MASAVTAFRFRLYPTAKQEAKLSRMIETGRRLWNDALSHRKHRWEEERLSTSYDQQRLILTRERKADSFLRELYSQAGQDILRRLDNAFEAFFERRASYPKFKKFSESGSFTYPQAYNGCVKLDGLRKRLLLSRIGDVRVVQHRPVPKDGELKTCTVKREHDGKWYATLTYEAEVEEHGQTRAFASPVGVDLGLKSLVTTSDGEQTEPPKFLRKAEKRLRMLQQRLSLKRQGSRNRSRARSLLAVQHSKVKNQRADFNHKLSAKIVEGHDLIVFEDLRVKNMVKVRGLAKSIRDAAWGQLVGFVEYKAARRGKRFVKVPAPYTTQECDFCGILNNVSLDVRQFECVGCCRMLDRDVNAARIVLKRGIVQVGRDTPELKPVETGPLLPRTTETACLVDEAGTIRGGIQASQRNAAAGRPRNRPWEDVTRVWRALSRGPGG